MTTPAPKPNEPHNPFYLVLLILGIVFVITVLAVAVVPVLEEKAIEAGTIPPPSPFRDELRTHGYRWVLYEVAAIVVLGMASMMLDRYRRWKTENEKPPTNLDGA